MSFRLEIVGIKEKQAQIAALIGELEDMGDLWERYAEVMSQSEAEWFATQGEGMWPPLKEDTLREKLRRGWPPETLVRRGDLRESLIDPAQAMSIDQGRSTLGTFTRNSMTWGTDVRDDRGREFAHYHQHGDPVTGEVMDYGNRPPERQVIPWPLPAHWVARLDAADEDWMADAIRGSGLA